MKTPAEAGKGKGETGLLSRTPQRKAWRKYPEAGPCNLKKAPLQMQAAESLKAAPNAQGAISTKNCF